MNVPELKANQMITITYFVGLVIVIFIVLQLLKKIGLVKSAAKKRSEKEQKAAVEMLATDDYFKPSYYKDKKFKSIGSNSANQYSQLLHKAIRGLGTDENAIYSTFGKLYNKTNISEIAESYNLQYGKDLQTDLLNDLTDKEITKLMNIINGLPL